MLEQNPEKSLMLMLIRLGRLITNTIKESLDEKDQKLIGPHMGVLVDLYNKDGVRQQDLVVSSIKDKATITRALQFLEKGEFVLRTPDPVDRRTKRIYITSKGRKTYQRIFPQAQIVLQKSIDNIDAEELSVLSGTLNKIYNNLLN